MANPPQNQQAGQELEIVQFTPEEKIGLWTVEKKLGQGAFGAVYLVKNNKGEHYALKVEGANEIVKVLKMEVFVMTELKRIHGRHFCDLLDNGKIGNFNYIVMTLVGRSLYDLRKSVSIDQAKQKFSLGCALSVGIQCVEAIEDLHLAGYLHRDIKPGNYAIGHNEPRRIYLLDFGMARRYLDQHGSIKRPRWAAGFRGTVRYAPISCHISREQSRKDDLEAWLYTQVEMTNGNLPWKSIDDKDEVGRFKERCRNDGLKDFLTGCPKQYADIMECIDNVRYYTTPDYKKIYNLLRFVIQSNELEVYPYDWEKQT